MTEIEFVTSHQPQLKAGEYRVRVGQRLQADGHDIGFGVARTGAPKSDASLRFGAHGPRLALPPGAISARFPVPGSVGHEAGIMPHIVLNDDTLPWLRTAGGSAASDDTPWMALVVFGHDELAKVTRTTKAADELHNDLEPGQAADEKALVLSVPTNMASDVLPRGHDIKYLAHVREAVGRSPQAVVVANRFTIAGGVNEVHLISVADIDLDQLAGPTVELISLAHWTFESTDSGHGFRELALALAHNSGVLRHQHEDPVADSYLRSGVLPMRHGSTFSFYRGPLAPSVGGPAADAVRAALESDEPPRRSDDLVLFDQGAQTRDVSYAVAFDLGRSLMLADTDLALSLESFHRAQRHEGHQKDGLQGLLDHRGSQKPLPAGVEAWFESLLRLDEVPARYLIPDLDRLVPLTVAQWRDAKSGIEHEVPGRIAFFSVDPVWQQALVLGAFSVGAVTTLEQPDRYPGQISRMHGFVLRSPITRWEDLDINVWPGDPAPGDPTLELITRDLGADLKLVMFEHEGSTPLTIELTRHPHGLHFGVEEPPGSPGGPKKHRPSLVIRREAMVDVPLRANSATTIDIASLVTSVTTHVIGHHSAEFARAMVVGSPAIRFTLDPKVTT